MKQDLRELLTRKEVLRTLLVILGAFLYVIGMNLFVVPAGIYSGGVMGACQIIRTLIIDYLHIPLGQFDIAGIIYYIVNIPIMYIAYKHMGKLFFLKTILCVTAMMLFFSFVPIPTAMLITDDKLTSCIIGGIIAGVGCGLALMMGGCAGGMDIIGIYYIKRSGNFSVGKANLFMNLVVYLLCLFLSDITTVIYSVIYACACSIAVDKVHSQNINVEVIIISRCFSREMQMTIMNELGRGITKWNSTGAYTLEDSEIYYIILSKYEINQLRHIVHQYDSEAFIVVKEGVNVSGNYLRKV